MDFDITFLVHFIDCISCTSTSPD